MIRMPARCPDQSSASACPRSDDRPVRILHSAGYYDYGRVLGNGSFGVVCEARCIETGERVAIKKVLQDPRYKNRELDVMKELNHPNVVSLKDYFYTESPAQSSDRGNSSSEQKETQRFLNVVMDYVPETVYRTMKSYTRSNQPLPLPLVRLYTYQMCRGLGYLHSLAICHRDIKPQNLLVDCRSHVLMLCDFGSAKRLLQGEHSVSYICSRFYRAPELMLGATEYTTAIDIWSIGCVFGELLMGKPLFAGETSVDQLVKIIQVLGTPTRLQMQAMSPNYTDFTFPNVLPKDWRSVLSSSAVGGGAHVTDDALDLLDQLLRYEPSERLTPYDTLAHSFFDPLRQPGCQLSEGQPLPPNLFDFSEHEMQYMSERARAKLMPSWSRQNHISNTHNRQPQPPIQPQPQGYSHGAADIPPPPPPATSPDTFTFRPPPLFPATTTRLRATTTNADEGPIPGGAHTFILGRRPPLLFDQHPTTSSIPQFQLSPPPQQQLQTRLPQPSQQQPQQQQQLRQQPQQQPPNLLPQSITAPFQIRPHSCD